MATAEAPAPVFAYTTTQVVRAAEAGTLPLGVLSSHLFVSSFSLRATPSRGVAVQATDLAAENAEWDAVFEAKQEALAKMVADVKARVARGEARPLDMNDFQD